MCGTPLHQLRRLALHSALGLALDSNPNLQSRPSSGLLAPHPSLSSPRPTWVNLGLSSATTQHPSRYHVEPVAGIKHKEMGWIRSGAAGMDIKPSCHATVTPLPIYAQQYLEGVWSVTTVSRSDLQPQSQVRTTSPPKCLCRTKTCTNIWDFLTRHVLWYRGGFSALTNHSPKLSLGAWLKYRMTHFLPLNRASYRHLGNQHKSKFSKKKIIYSITSNVVKIS